MMQNSLYNILTLHVYTSLIEIGTFKSTTSIVILLLSKVSVLVVLLNVSLLEMHKSAAPL